MIPLWLQFTVATIIVFGSMGLYKKLEAMYFERKYSGEPPSPMPIEDESGAIGSNLYNTQEPYNRYESGNYQGGDL